MTYETRTFLYTRRKYGFGTTLITHCTGDQSVLEVQCFVDPSIALSVSWHICDTALSQCTGIVKTIETTEMCFWKNVQSMMDKN